MSKQKQYIGSGKPAKNNSVTVTLALDKAQQHAYTTETGTYITFVLSPKQQADQYGKTHAAFVMVNLPEAQPEAVVSEPQAELPLDGETPVGATVQKNGRNLKRISKEEAAQLRAKK